MLWVGRSQSMRISVLPDARVRSIRTSTTGGRVPSDITVGLDIGTTSVKALAVAGDGEIVARARVPHEAFSPSADVFEHDARKAWVAGPRRALDELELKDFAAISFASLMP